MTPDEARAVLGVGPLADVDEVHAAYRRITARVHPDAGGTPELARRVKTARDILVAEISRRPPATL
jgi:DnaJ family protein C protein 19